MEATSLISSVSVSNSDKSKKNVSFKSFLDAKRIEKTKIREYFLENCSNIPQELRLVLWKICLGISNSFQNQYASSDKLLEDHYLYLRNTLTKLLEINSNKPDEMNFLVYLLDRGDLPLFNYQIKQIQNGHPFCLIFKQMCDILDDQNDFESFYLTSELVDYLSGNLIRMKSTFYSNLPKDLNNRALIEQIDIDIFLLCGLACTFKDVKIYHVIWDRLVMGESELLVFTLIGFLETCKDEQLRLLQKDLNYSNLNMVLKFGVDEAKILKKAIKYYKNFHSNQNISNMIINYFNSK